MFVDYDWPQKDEDQMIILPTNKNKQPLLEAKYDFFQSSPEIIDKFGEFSNSDYFYGQIKGVWVFELIGTKSTPIQFDVDISTAQDVNDHGVPSVFSE